jgi:formylglycine-generating enzyme required for sulfatase activity
LSMQQSPRSVRGAKASMTRQPCDHDQRQGGGTKGEYRRQTVPVDTFEANHWGLFNVHGNVWEWTEDCWK